MKKIEAVIPTEKVSIVNEELKKVGIGGLIVDEVKGRGAGKRAPVAVARGTSYYVPEFHSRTMLITVVDDSLVDKVVDAIISVTSTGSPGDGKIFIYNVDDAIDIGTRKRGKEAI
ncbi:MAG: P-II family nitrogen regulator [Candidatus Nitrosothermus koennekii]|nr:MAG: P-II family nitrogen regulator [Candidatus Nitrosothermus koennekii]